MRLHFAVFARRAGRAAAVVALGAAALVVPMTGAATAAQAPAEHRPVAQRIELTRTGGIAGATTRFVIDRADTARDAVRALKLASGARFRALRSAYQPDSPCCDHFQYVVAVTYADGATKTVTTWSNAGAAPRVLRDVVRLTERAGVQLPPPSNPAAAQRVDLVRSGGVAGQTVRLFIDPTNTAPNAVLALQLAATAQFRALAPDYPPANPCCDRFRYDVTVTYPDDARKAVRYWSHVDAPQVLLDVIRLTERNGRSPAAA